MNIQKTLNIPFRNIGNQKNNFQFSFYNKFIILFKNIIIFLRNRLQI
ncbi:hypothetical protein LEP1GSC008_4163 [Leptospira kirschneri serovar Bulgarica str. Nikolaevo]|uniref:Uncharacterized protein n=1 Tax=Leptospira kirschneri serovar Bulgarica str. Nikolaevo TaxID=1240687 RepID=M6F6Z8_9LEPT|nr:hypothetical protein LEP1GSC008_4163 [Leptospira kirschneri serovar Bulgarica str. Nikolaevo]